MGRRTVFPNGGANDQGILQRFYDIGSIPGGAPILGNVFYVDSVKGTATGPGWTPDNAYATINQAVAVCTADNGDIIAVAPNHVETVTGAAGVALTVAGVTVLGLGPNPRAQTVNFTTAVGASFDITAARCKVLNMGFTVGFDNLTAMMNINKADVIIDGCDFMVSDGTNGAAICILTAATATRLKVLNTRFIGPAINAGTTCAACIQHEAGLDYVIQRCTFMGKMTQAILNVATLLSGHIDDNRFVIYTGTKGIAVAAASTPFISNNRFNVPSGTAPIVAAAGFVIGNLYSAAAGVTAPTAATF